MIVRIQFVTTEKLLHGWALFITDEGISLRELFKKVQGGEISCGRGIDLHNYDDSPLASTSVSNKPPLKSELMPTRLNFTLASLKGHLPIYIAFECVLKEDETDDLSTNDNTPQQQVSDTITNVLMKKCDHFVSFKTESGRNNVKQYNALINLTRDHKFGVRASYLLRRGYNIFSGLVKKSLSFLTFCILSFLVDKIN